MIWSVLQQADGSKGRGAVVADDDCWVGVVVPDLFGCGRHLGRPFPFLENSRHAKPRPSGANRIYMILKSSGPLVRMCSCGAGLNRLMDSAGSICSKYNFIWYWSKANQNLPTKSRQERSTVEEYTRTLNSSITNLQYTFQVRPRLVAPGIQFSRDPRSET